MLVFVSLGMSAQTTPSYKNVKLTQLPLGTKNDSIVLTNGSTKLLKYMPVSQVLSSKENVSNKDNGELTTSTQTYPTSAAVKGELDNIKSQINPNNYIITDAGSSLSINTFTLNAGWSWKINNVSYTNPSLVNINVPLASSGYTRIDLIVLNASNTAVIVLGVQSAGTAITPNVPLNTIAISSVFSDSTVHTVVIPKPRYPVSQYLRDGITDYSPSENIVYDALVLKKSISTGNNYKWETTSATGSLQETTVTPSKAVATDANGLPIASATTATELGYVNGVTSAIQTQLNTKLSSFGSVTTNYLPKVTGTNIFGNSRIFDNGTYLGIDAANPTKDITFGNQSDREIGIEESANTYAGKNLDIRAGRSINFASSNFEALNQTPRNWYATAAAPNGNIYATAYNGSSNIYVRYAGTGNFIDYGYLGGLGMCVAPNGDIYVANNNATIVKQTGGTGGFASVSASGNWWGMCAAPNGDIYVVQNGGNIFKQTGGTGSFTSLAQTVRGWTFICAAPNGDIYATADRDIWKQTGGTGNFLPLGQVSRNYSGITATPNGNIYVAVNGEGIYMQSGGVGTFNSLSQATRSWSSLSSDTVGNVYASSVYNNGTGDLYLLTNNALGSPNLNGGSVKLSSGTGKGTGSSNLEIYTGQKLASGTDMQISTLRLKIDNEGHITSTTMPVYADNTAALAGGLTTGKFYRTSTGTLMIVY